MSNNGNAAGTELIPYEINPDEVFKPGGLDPVLKEIERRALEEEYGVETAKDRKAIASMAYKVARSKTFIDGLRKKYVSDEKARLKVIDQAGKHAVDFLDALRDRIRQPLNEWEEAEKAKAEAERIAKEKEEAHETAIIENDLFDQRREVARQQAEIDRQKAEREKAEYEDRIRKEAAEKAKQEAEQIAKEKHLKLVREKWEVEEAKKRAENERAAAIQRQKDEAVRLEREKQEAIEAERHKAKAEAERVEAERVAKEKAEAEEAERRKRDLENRKRVETDAINDMISCGITPAQAFILIEKISNGKIRGISIKY